MRFRHSNPVFKRYESTYGVQTSEYEATYAGVFRKTLLLLLLTASIAYYVGTLPTEQFTTGYIIGALIVAPIISFIMVILTHTNPAMSYIYSIIYAIFEGVFLGVITMFVAAYTDGPIVLYAISGTFGTVFVMLLVYGLGIVTVGERFKSFTITAFITLILLSLVYVFGSLFGVFTITNSLTFYMTIVVFSILVSTLYLLFDFERVREMVSMGVDKQYEWSLAIGIIVVIVWLYIDILRLLAIVMNRD